MSQLAIPIRESAESVHDNRVWNVLRLHIGRSNSITRTDLVQRVGINDRQVRITIKRLVEEKHKPIGSLSSGEGAGYFVLRNDDERQAVSAEIKSRIASLGNRLRVIEHLSPAGVGQVVAAEVSAMLWDGTGPGRDVVPARAVLRGHIIEARDAKGRMIPYLCGAREMVAPLIRRLAPHLEIGEGGKL